MNTANELIVKDDDDMFKVMCIKGIVTEVVKGYLLASGKWLVYYYDESNDGLVEVVKADKADAMVYAIEKAEGKK